MNYDLELSKVIEEIKVVKAKTICLQLPDGLKPEAEKIVKKIEEKTQAKVVIWLGSNFGACDLPAGLEKLHVDLLISWGHNKFVKGVGW
jgi:diphthamide biosynthesis enzyme Dph1/Dph2-like protein